MEHAFILLISYWEGARPVSDWHVGGVFSTWQKARDAMETVTAPEGTEIEYRIQESTVDFNYYTGKKV